MADDDAGLYGSSMGQNMIRAAVAEVIGTFILVFSGIAVATAALLERPTAGQPYDSLAVALSFGFALTAVVVALGHVSGAHLNPAVTLGLAATRKFPLRFVPAYVISQLVGATMAALATWMMFGDSAREDARVAATFLVQETSTGAGVVTEAIVTFILMFIVVSVATDERVPAAAAGPAIGFALALGVFIAGPVTGGAVNPARALGPMLVAGKFTDFWIYLVGPIAGAVAAAFLYDSFLVQAEAPEPEPSPASDSSRSEPKN